MGDMNKSKAVADFLRKNEDKFPGMYVTYDGTMVGNDFGPMNANRYISIDEFYNEHKIEIISRYFNSLKNENQENKFSRETKNIERNEIDEIINNAEKHSHYVKGVSLSSREPLTVYDMVKISNTVVLDNEKMPFITCVFIYKTDDDDGKYYYRTEIAQIDRMKKESCENVEYVYDNKSIAKTLIQFFDNLIEKKKVRGVYEVLLEQM